MTYNALTINDTYGVSPRSHFVTADGRDLDLRYLMLKNLPEKLKAMGVLFGAGSDISISADGKIYYADGVSIVDGDSGKVLVTKEYVDALFTGKYEPLGAVQNHVDSVDHLVIGFASDGVFGISFSPDECISMYSSSSVARLKAASLYHHHDDRYALKSHTHTEIASTVNNTITEFLDKYVSIEVVPETISKRDSYGVLKGTDPYTVDPDEEEETADSEVSSVSTSKGPPMDSLVNVLSLKRRLQPKYIRCKLTAKPFVPDFRGTDIADAHRDDGDGDIPVQDYSSGLQWNNIRNLRQLLEYLHPGLHFEQLGDINETKIFWGVTNFNQTQINQWISRAFNEVDLNDYPRRFFLKDDYNDAINVRIHDSTVKFNRAANNASVMVPLIDYRLENILDPYDLENIANPMNIALLDTDEGYHFWLAIPDSAYINGSTTINLQNIDNDPGAIIGDLVENWGVTDGFAYDDTITIDTWSTENFHSEVTNLCKIKDLNGNLYTIYVSPYSYTGSLYRFNLSRPS